PALAGRRSRIVDPVHRSDRRGDRVGWVRRNSCPDRYLDVLARKGPPRRVARPRPSGCGRPMGKTWLPPARRRGERPPHLAIAECFLRARVDRPSRYLAWRSHPTRTLVLLPRLLTISGIFDGGSPRRASRCRRESGGPD